MAKPCHIDERVSVDVTQFVFPTKLQSCNEGGVSKAVIFGPQLEFKMPQQPESFVSCWVIISQEVDTSVFKYVYNSLQDARIAHRAYFFCTSICPATHHLKFNTRPGAILLQAESSQVCSFVPVTFAATISLV